MLKDCAAAASGALLRLRLLCLAHDWNVTSGKPHFIPAIVIDNAYSQRVWVVSWKAIK